jgi:nitrite reductase/ring-hydroxylating ferredoxin subunit
MCVRVCAALSPPRHSHLFLHRLRIFCIAESDDNSIQMEQDLALFLRLLRIDADVHVVELMNNEVSAHATNRAKHLEVHNPFIRFFFIFFSLVLFFVEFCVFYIYERFGESKHGVDTPSLTDMTHTFPCKLALVIISGGTHLRSHLCSHQLAHTPSLTHKAHTFPCTLLRSRSHQAERAAETGEPLTEPSQSMLRRMSTATRVNAALTDRSKVCMCMYVCVCVCVCDESRCRAH